MRISVAHLAFIALPAVLSAQDTPPAPKQALKAEIKIGEGKDAVALAAKRPEMASRANLFTGEKFWRLIFPANQQAVPVGPLTLTTTLDPNELPGGGLFVCSMKKDDDKVFFNTSSDAAGAPKGGFVAVKPGDFQTTKNPDGTFTYKTTKALKPGYFAIYVSDNQYAWPFIVK